MNLLANFLCVLHLKHHVNLTINNDNYGGPQLPHQNQMHTANSNRSQRIQIAHSELQITHSKLQIAHSKLQIAHSKLQIAHSKFKWPTANSNRSKQIQESAFLSRVEGITLTLTLTLTVTTNLRPVHPSAFDLQPCADLFTWEFSGHFVQRDQANSIRSRSKSYSSKFRLCLPNCWAFG